jgi:hypothetical protein
MELLSLEYLLSINLDVLHPLDVCLHPYIIFFLLQNRLYLVIVRDFPILHPHQMDEFVLTLFLLILFILHSLQKLIVLNEEVLVISAH